MTNQIDNFHKLARYDTNMQGELHANLLRNNGITVSLQALSGLPGMNSGAVLWVQDTDLAQAQLILASIDTDSTDNATDTLESYGSDNHDDKSDSINKGGNV